MYQTKTVWASLTTLNENIMHRFGHSCACIRRCMTCAIILATQKECSTNTAPQKSGSSQLCDGMCPLRSAWKGMRIAPLVGSAVSILPKGAEMSNQELQPRNPSAVGRNKATSQNVTLHVESPLDRTEKCMRNILACVRSSNSTSSRDTEGLRKK